MESGSGRHRPTRHDTGRDDTQRDDTRRDGTRRENTRRDGIELDHSFDALDVVAFLAELVLWTACGVAAFRVAGGGLLGGLTAGAVVLLVVVGWSLVMAPRAPRRVGVTGRNLVVLALGTAATAALLLVGAPAWAAAGAASTLLMVVADRTRRTTRAGA